MLQGNSALSELWGEATAIEALAIALGIVAVIITVGSIMAIVRRARIKKHLGR
jgi:hypothetical protein